VLGLYDSSTQGIVERHMDWFVQHGIDVVGVEWNGTAREEDNIVNHLVPSIQSRNLKFVLLYDIAIRFPGSGVTLNFDSTDSRALFVRDLTNFAGNASYMKHPSYLKFGDRPVIYIYVTRAIDGSHDNIQLAFDQALVAVRANGFEGLYLVADHLFWGNTDYAKLQRMSPAAVTSFAPVSDGIVPPSDARPVKTWADEIKDVLYEPARRDTLPDIGRVDLTPGIFVQYDDESTASPCFLNRQGTASWHLVDGDDWSYMVRTAGVDERWIAEKTRVRRDCSQVVTTNTDYTSIVWTYSFNEWAEGSGMEPLENRAPPYPYGFGFDAIQRLQAVKAASGTGVPPAPIQRTPFGESEGLRPNFGWDGVQFGIEYELEVFDSQAMRVIHRTAPGNVHIAAFDFAQGQPYTWRVRARTGGGWGPFSDLVSFVRTGPEPSPSPSPSASPGAICRNGTCEAGEDKETCPDDCGLVGTGSICPNGRCEPGERFVIIGLDGGEAEWVTTCPADCHSCGEIGGDYCGHSSESCPAGSVSVGAAYDCNPCCKSQSPPDPGPSCGALGGDYCSQSGSCPSGYDSLGQSNDCNPCCKSQPPPDPGPSCGALGGDYCGQSGSCPGGYDSLGQSSDCHPCCKSHPPPDPGPSCGALGGDYCSQSGVCPGGYDSLGESYDCNPCCKSQPPPPTCYDTCYNQVCDTDWRWVDDWCESCSSVCDTCSDCQTYCDDDGNCWEECSTYDCNCHDECSSFICGGHYEPYETNCHGEPYECNPHPCP
jgi:hypothetical protein